MDKELNQVIAPLQIKRTLPSEINVDAYALENCYNSVPNPKLVILCGACAISGGVYQNSEEIDRSFIENCSLLSIAYISHAVSLKIPELAISLYSFTSTKKLIS